MSEIDIENLRHLQNHIKNKISVWYKKLAELESDFKLHQLSYSEFLYELSLLEEDLAKIKIPIPP